MMQTPSGVCLMVMFSSLIMSTHINRIKGVSCYNLTEFSPFRWLVVTLQEVGKN